MGRYLFHCIDGIFHGNRIVSAKRGVLFLLSGILSGIFSLPDHKCLCSAVDLYEHDCTCLLYTSDKYSMNAGKRDAEASFLPAYHYSPWKEGRTKAVSYTHLSVCGEQGTPFFRTEKIYPAAEKGLPHLFLPKLQAEDSYSEGKRQGKRALSKMWDRICKK